MNDIFDFLKQYELLIYLFLLVLFIWQVSKLSAAWNTLRSASFNLEQESARARLNGTAIFLIGLIVLAVSEFILASIVLPSHPNNSELPTPTLNFLTTPIENGFETPSAATTPEPGQPTPGNISIGCIPEESIITSPRIGETVRGLIEIYGTATIPNFGFYKFEISRTTDDNWITIQAWDKPIVDGMLGFVDTTTLSREPYRLSLIVTDNQGNDREPCIIEINIAEPEE